MKKLLVLFLSVCLLFAFTACVDTTNPNQEPVEGEEQTTSQTTNGTQTEGDKTPPTPDAWPSETLKPAGSEDSSSTSKVEETTAPAQTKEPDTYSNIYFDFSSMRLDEPKYSEARIHYAAPLTAEIIVQELTNHTGLNFSINSVTVKNSTSVFVDWADDATLITNTGYSALKPDFSEINSSEAMRWFMLDTLWMSLKDNFEIDYLYFTMNGGEVLKLNDFNPSLNFDFTQPYTGNPYNYDYSHIGDPEGTPAIKEDTSFTFNEDVLTYGGVDYPLDEPSVKVAQISQAYDVGDDIVLMGYSINGNKFYHVFNKDKKSYQGHFYAHDAIWHSDDIDTCLFILDGKVYDYGFNEIGEYNLTPGHAIAGLSFADNYKTLDIAFVREDTTMYYFPIPLA